MSDCRFGVSPVNYPDPDPDRHKTTGLRGRGGGGVGGMDQVRHKPACAATEAS